MATETKTLIYEIKWDDAQAVKGSNAWTKRLSALQKEAEKSFKNISKSFKIEPPPLPKVLTELEKIGDEFDRLREKSKRTWEGMGTSALGALGAIADAGRVVANIFEPVIGAGIDVVENSIDLEDAMNGVKRTANLTTEQVASLTAQVRDYAVESLKGFGSSTQLAEALEIAGQQGLFFGKTFEQGSQDALVFSSTMVKAAVALDGLDLQKASERLGLFHGVFTDFIPTIENSASVLNHFGNTTKRGSDFILDLAGRMSEAANFVGLTEAETLALAATMGELNQSAQKTGTAMTRILREMRGNSTAFAESFGLDAEKFVKLTRTDMPEAINVLSQRISELGQSQEGIDVVLNALSDLELTGGGVSATMLGLGNVTDKVNKNFKEAAEQWELNTSLMDEFISSSDRVSKLWGAFKEIISNTVGVVGDMMLPVLKELLLNINEQAAMFREWFKESSFVTEVLPAAFDELNAILQELVASAITFLQEFDFSKLIADIQKFKENIDLRETLESVLSVAQQLFTFLVDTLPDVLDLIASIVDVFNDLEAVIGPIFNLMKVGFGGLAEQISRPFKVLGGFVDLLGKAGGAIKEFFSKTSEGGEASAQNIEKISDSLDKVDESTVKAAEEMYGNSFLPDTVSWSQQATTALQGVNRQINTMVPAIQTAGNAMASLSSINSRLNSQQLATAPVSQSSRFAGGQIRRADNQQVTQQSIQPVTNINFNGTNVVDSSSQRRYVRTVTQTQQQQAARTVQGSTPRSSYGYGRG
jgi:TP901 family phage tail tape measure protein